MSLNEKESDVAGLTINRPQHTPSKINHSNILPTIEDADSVHSMTPTLTPAVTRSHDDREASPLSPFYSHPTTRYSLEGQKSESKLNINVYDSDVEACLTDSNTNALQSATTTKTNKECTVWPGQRALMEKKKAAKRQKGCNPMRNLDKRTKLWVKICIAVLFVGIAVGVSIGISKAVGGGVWGPNSGSKPISR
jgi:hypothetical protein